MRRVLGIAVATFVLTACGTASAERNSQTTPAPAGPGTSSALPRGGGAPGPRGVQPPETRGPTFPLTLRRTGGIGGYDDTVVLEASGEVLVDTRTVHGRVCMLSKHRRVQLYGVLETLRHSGEVSPEGTSTGVGESDVIRISLTDAHHHPFDLSDPSLGSVSDLVGALISDVTLTSPATVSCKPAGV
jgi:hypothetical protein